MNLLTSDVLNAREVLEELGISGDKISAGWSNGNISLVVTCSSRQKDLVLKALQEKTTINIPIMIEEDFTPKW